MTAIYAAIEQSSSDFRGNVTDLVEAFYPSKPKNNDFLWIEILTGIATAISAATTFTGDPAVGAAGAFFAGAIQEGINALQVSASSTTIEVGDLDA